MQQNTLKGILWMLVVITFNASALSLAKYVVTGGISVYQAVFLCNIIGLIFCIPWVVKSGVSSLKTTKTKLYISRMIVEIGAVGLWYTSISLIPLSEASALNFVTPVFVSILGIFLLKEKNYVHRWLALFAGFVGVIIILQPGREIIHYASLMVLVSSLGYAFVNIIVKVLSETENPHNIAFYKFLFTTIIALPLALLNWQEINNDIMIFVLLFGFATWCLQTSLPKAFSYADVTALMPFSYLNLVLTSTIAYFVFVEIPETEIFIGAAVIMCAISYVTFKENKVKNK